MPSRNVVKIYVPDSYYHIYNRGVEGRTVFQDDEDYRVYLNLFKRYLDTKPHADTAGREYEWLKGSIELLAYCLMPTHYHLLVYVGEDETAMTRLLRGINSSYTVYFNKKYQRVGPLFQSRYKACRIENEAYLEHITRYIHLNPKHWKTYKFSSLPYFLELKQAQWLNPQRVMETFKDKEEYSAFLEDYESQKQIFDDLKWELADS